jgi:hypothetical protein
MNNKPTPESAVLPKNVMRFRAVYGYAWGDKGYDKDGKEVKTGYDLSGSGYAGVLEYGVTDDISLQVVVPWAGKKELTTNDDYETQLKKGAYDEDFNLAFVEKTGMTPTALPATVATEVLTQLIAAKTLATCTATPADCADGGMTVQAATTAAFTTGQVTAATVGTMIGSEGLDFEKLAEYAATLVENGTDAQKEQATKFAALVKALKPVALGKDTKVTSVNLASAFETAVAKFKKAEVAKSIESKEFQEGLGDIETGVKYAFSTVKNPLVAGLPLYSSVAFGVRWNTSDFAGAVKDGKRPVGRGTTDYGLRLNVDYLPINGIALSWENQTEGQLMKGQIEVFGKKVDFERDGMRQVGYGKLVIDPSAWVDALGFISFTEKYNYNYEAAVKVDGTKQESDEVEQSRSFTTSVGFSGFPYSVPLQLDVDYTMPLGGKNVALATNSIATTLKAFYKF